MNRGRPRAAHAAAARCASCCRRSHAALRLRVLDALYARGRHRGGRGRGRELARRPARRRRRTPTASRARQLADACVLAQWRLTRGRHGGRRALVARLRAAAGRVVALPAPRRRRRVRARPARRRAGGAPGRRDALDARARGSTRSCPRRPRSRRRGDVRPAARRPAARAARATRSARSRRCVGGVHGDVAAVSRDCLARGGAARRARRRRRRRAVGVRTLPRAARSPGGARG